MGFKPAILGNQHVSSVSPTMRAYTFGAVAPSVLINNTRELDPKPAGRRQALLANQ
jgi:hypothetical protein